MVVVKIKCGLVEGELSTVSEKIQYQAVSGNCHGVLKFVREF